MSYQLSLWDTDSATSSLASQAGPTHCNSPAGQQTGQSGPVAAHANLSARQAREKGLLTSGTYGPPSTGSSRSVGLQSYLVNKLAARLACLGSTMYRLIWSKVVMPSGRSHSRLAASARPICASDCTGWPTPVRTDGEKCGRVKARKDAMGLSETGALFREEMENSAPLNPHLARWLMGYPPEWCQAAVVAYRSRQKGRQSKKHGG